MRPGDQRGYAYLAVLLAITILGISMSVTGSVWYETSRREKEVELLFAGDQFRRAIQQYYESSPGPKRYPATLEDLLVDPRYPGTRRYLRRLYRDPLTGKAQWGLLIAPEGGIMGVHSQGQGRPQKQTGFPAPYGSFEARARYSDWEFTYRP